MKLTKYEHACFTLEVAGEVLVVDPGGYTKNFTAGDNVAAIVITHQHPDHFDTQMLTKIFSKNPNAVLVSLASVIKAIPGHQSKAVRTGDRVEIGPFKLRFFGGKHALIDVSIALIDNLGVLINDTLYYPGDSFTLPNVPVDVLALPIGAPWPKMNEVIDFLTAIKPLLAFPTHDAVLSTVGKSLSDQMLSVTAIKIGAEYKRIDKTPIAV
ncbi:MAG: MBL fold metallo-hydrolase [Candidatus Saccharibacteria bacterium]